ncbi:MAG: hypothetical protein AAB686_01360, partial [Patescibacteria group bacterium]
AIKNIKIDKMISGDGRKALLLTNPEGWIYPATIFPTVSLDDADGYSVYRNLGLYGATPASYSSTHNQYYVGDGTWWFMTPSGAVTGAWWRLKAVGSAADGGPLYSGDLIPPSDQSPYDFGEAWPENTVGGTNPGPFGSDYWSHFVPDRWGRYALFGNGDTNPIGPGVWDIANHIYSVETFGGSSQHHDWHGFTDYFVASEGRGGFIRSAKYNDPNSMFNVSSSYTRYDGGTSYETLTRPGQSPDGTKVSWHSEFLNGQNMPDVFWSVVYYPYPPTDLGAASAAGSGVALSFLPPKYTNRRWIDPATGKIDEVNGEVLYAREIKQYHVWRSASSTMGWDTVGTVAAEY